MVQPKKNFRRSTDPDQDQKNKLKPRKTNFPAPTTSPVKNSNKHNFKLIKKKNKENRWEVKNTLDKPKNHKMQDISIRVCCEHIVFSDPHSSERLFSKTRLKFKKLLDTHPQAIEAKTPSEGVN
jgi:hypothetical protein